MTLAIINYLMPLGNSPMKLHERENRLSKFHSFIRKINENSEGKLYRSQKTSGLFAGKYSTLGCFAISQHTTTSESNLSTALRIILYWKLNMNRHEGF